MTGIRYDLSDVDPDESTAVRSFDSPQPGMYVATILEITKKPSKSGGGPILEVKFEITDADKSKNKQFAGSHLWWYAMLPGHDSWDDTAWKLDQFLQALGVATKRKRKGSFDPDKHVGEELLINVRPGKNQNGEYRGEVGAVLQYDEDEWASGDDEDDDDVEYDEDDVEADEDEEGDGDEDEDEDEDEEEEDEEAGEYDDMALTALRKEARSRGLKPAGLDKGDIIEMLEADDEDEGSEEEGEEEDEEEEEEEPAPKPRRKTAAKKTAAKKPTARKKSTAKKSTAKGGTRARSKKSGFPFDE